MTVLDEVEKLETSKIFKDWSKKHNKAYLAHCFKMFDETNKDFWQIGYFNPETNLITVFVVGNDITKNEDAEVYKEQEKLVEKLNLKEVSIFEDLAMEKAEEILAKEYPKTGVFKKFIILQKLEEPGQIWNVTFITNQFKTVNVKISSQTGKVESHKQVSLIESKDIVKK
jgi:hypothetical protein